MAAEGALPDKQQKYIGQLKKGPKSHSLDNYVGTLVNNVKAATCNPYTSHSLVTTLSTGVFLKILACETPASRKR